MNPYLGADVLVSVDAAHNNGSPVAPGKITAVRPGGRVNVRVFYDAPPHLLGHRVPEHIADAAFHDTTDPAAAMRLGQYGAFWPPFGADLALILENQEIIMAAQDDINAAVTAVNGLLTDMQAKVADATTQIATIGTDLTAIQGLIAAGQPVDTSALNTAVGNVAAVQASLDSMDAALDTAVANLTAVAVPPTPAAPAAPAAPVASGDSGSAA